MHDGKDESQRRGGRRAMLLLVAAAMFAVGCNEPFAPFNELDKLRVLGVRAEPPSLAPGEVAQLEALVFEPDGDPVSYRWSWCPFSAGSINGYECLVDEDEVREMIDEVAPGFGALFPGFDLGDGETATLLYPGTPELLQQFCAMASEAGAPAFADLPSCDAGLTLTIRVDLEAGGETVSAVKQVPVVFDPELADNENPSIGEVRASLGSDEVGQLLMTDAEASLARDRRYQLAVEVPEAASQSYLPEPDEYEPNPEPEREYLFMSWFVAGGSTDQKRTTFIDGEISLKELGSNSWRTPADGEQAQLFLVLQDERGGVSWTERTVALEE